GCAARRGRSRGRVGAERGPRDRAAANAGGRAALLARVPARARRGCDPQRGRRASTAAGRLARRVVLFRGRLRRLACFTFFSTVKQHPGALRESGRWTSSAPSNGESWSVF